MTATTSAPSESATTTGHLRRESGMSRSAIVRAVALLHVGAAAGFAGLYAFFWLRGATWLDGLVIGVAVLATLASAAAFLELRRNYTRRASNWVLVSGFLTVTLAQAATGFTYPWFVLYFWLIALGGLLRGRSTAVVLSLTEFAALVGLFVLAAFDLIAPPDPDTLLSPMSLGIVLVGILLNAFVSWRMNGELIAVQMRTGSQVSHLSEDLSDMSTSQAQRAVHQAEIVLEAATALQQLNASAEEIARMSELVNRAALNDLNQSTEAQEIVTDSVREMGNVRTMSQRVIDRMAELSAMANQIGRVISLIQGLAREMQLLALNAGIEAAGAGEHGVRFGVIAGEVKRLAVRSLDATTEIEGVLGEIQSGTERVSRALGENVEAIEQTSRRASGMSTVMSELVTSVQRSATYAEQINNATSEQLAAGDQVSSLMNTVRAESIELSEQAQQLSQAARQLEQIAQRLIES